MNIYMLGLSCHSCLNKNPVELRTKEPFFKYATKRNDTGCKEEIFTVFPRASYIFGQGSLKIHMQEQPPMQVTVVRVNDRVH